MNRTRVNENVTTPAPKDLLTFALYIKKLFSFFVKTILRIETRRVYYEEVPSLVSKNSREVLDRYIYTLVACLQWTRLSVENSIQ